MKKILLSLFLAGSFAAQAQLKQPAQTPDRIILNMMTDPATSVAVTWRTAPSDAPAQAQITLATAAPTLKDSAKTVMAKSTIVDFDSLVSQFHSVNFTGLQPETLYAYRVGDGEVWSEWLQYKTAAAEAKPFSFIYFGDAQNDLKSMWSRAIRQAYSDLPKANFMLHAGDLINGYQINQEWDEWFYAGSFIHGMIPSIVTPGNHEYYGPNRRGQLNPYWQATFSLPANGPAGFEETVYYIDYQGVRIISLDSYRIIGSEVDRQVQAEWLKKVLENNPNKWTIITFHHPVYSTARGRDNKELRDSFKPIFDAYKVDLILQGHDHTYARGNNAPIGVQTQDQWTGTMYVVSVSGPKMYEHGEDAWWDKGIMQTQLYQLISIDGDELKYNAYKVTGELFDHFTLRKQANRPNMIID
ncbi:purple acid phosphatase family protein [Penaeicola halotolerans]|uniref:purple acid phosphatase family protein n=1 Tax=Penaeicola halotolerans TaxID=2793196 RepID=UPI001CF8BABB|nr:metallophosphoesterase family protein [Penaeicola halotolerans]